MQRDFSTLCPHCLQSSTAPTAADHCSSPNSSHRSVLSHPSTGRGKRRHSSDSSLLDKSDFDYSETLPPALELDETDCFVPVRKATSSSTILTLPTPVKKAGEHPKSSGKVLTSIESIRLMEEKEKRRQLQCKKRRKRKGFVRRRRRKKR